MDYSLTSQSVSGTSIRCACVFVCVPLSLEPLHKLDPNHSKTLTVDRSLI